MVVPSLTFVFPFCRGNDRIDPCKDPGLIIAFFKLRGHDLADDLPRERVRQNAFKTVTDFNPHFAVVLENEEDDTVVLFLLPGLPGFCEAHGKILEGLAFKRRERHDDKLITCCLFKGLQNAFELNSSGRRQHRRVIRHVAIRAFRDFKSGDNGKK